MATSVKFSRLAPIQHPTPPAMFSTTRYWLFWVLLLTVLGLGINAYFDFRNRELDKRLEQINMSYRLPSG
ncbi:MAG: hypothetical protein JNJ90_09310 [Saprospiraceae bacterium]|nr:hypothetical protein [Saprospiraceae bacterium]